MIDLTQTDLLNVQRVARDPGLDWVKDSEPSIEAAPDADVSPRPEARWDALAARTGICGAVSPRVVKLHSGFRMYYTQILPRAGFPAGAVDYGNATTRILSAVSNDGVKWTPEPGVRLSAEQGGAGEFRVASSEVVPVKGGGLRMFYECCPGTQDGPSTIRSAVSIDGLNWSVENGVRFGGGNKNYMAARIVFLEGERVRLYVCENGRGIISAISSDGGMTFREEPGVRIAQDGEFDKVAAFAPDIMRLPDGRFLMYYAGYGAPDRAHILRATSMDGLVWAKDARAVVAPGGKWDAVKCSEVSVFRVAGDGYRMVYEGCDGTAAGRRGVWRVAGAASKV